MNINIYSFEKAVAWHQLVYLAEILSLVLGKP